MKFYRFEESEYCGLDSALDGEFMDPNHPKPLVRLITLNLHKETPQGFWIGYGEPSKLFSTSRWISKYGKKRYAYPSKEQALWSFFKRKKQQVRIVKNQVRRAERALEDAERMLKIHESLQN